MVFAAHEIAIDDGNGPEIMIPGFRGTVRSLVPEMNRGVMRVVEPQGVTTRYLVLWSGGRYMSANEVVARLFVSPAKH